jgi:hypothetical protein
MFQIVLVGGVLWMSRMSIILETVLDALPSKCNCVWKNALTVELRWNEFEMVRLVGGLGIEAKLDATWLGQQSCFESHVGLQHL